MLFRLMWYSAYMQTNEWRLFRFIVVILLVVIVVLLSAIFISVSAEDNRSNKLEIEAQST